MAGPILEYIAIVNPDITIAKAYDPITELSYVRLSNTQPVVSLPVRSLNTSWKFKLASNISGPFVYPQDFFVEATPGNFSVWVLWVDNSQPQSEILGFSTIDPRSGDLVLARPAGDDPPPFYDRIRLLIESFTLNQIILKFNEGFQDDIKHDGVTHSCDMFVLDMAGTFFYDPSSASFSTEGSGRPYSKVTTQVPYQTAGVDFDAYLTTGNLIIPATPYVFGNNKLYIHTATSNGAMSMQVFKGGRYNTPPAKPLQMHIAVTETAVWTGDLVQPYRYSKQLFLKETTALTEKDQAVKVKLNFSVTDNTHDEIAVNAIYTKAGEHFITGGASI